MAKVKRYNGDEESLIEPGSGGVSDRYNPPDEKPAGGRFDEETYARARRFLERGGEEETPVAKPKKAAPKAAKPAPTRDELIEQIPTGQKGPTGGERVSGTERSRNISNTLAALTPIGGGVGKAAAEFAMTRGAARKAGEAAVRRSELAGELRRGQKATKFESKAPASRTRATRKYNEDEAGTEFKKGGAARGWGKARGARKAKIY